jgi:N-methylhydantoinase A
MTSKLAIDVGGTFTDLAFIDDKRKITLTKVASTPEDPLRCIREGLQLLSEENSVSDLQAFLNGVDLIIHGTTVGTNVLIQQKLAKTGLLCTKGFRDTLEFREGQKTAQERADRWYPPPPVLVPRYLRLPVEEKLTKDGEILTPLNENDVRQAIEKFRKEGVQSIAVCFLWSFANPVHEKRAREIVKEEFPRAYVSLSSEVLPLMREYPRVSTTVINASLMPIMYAYVERLEEFMCSLGKAQILYVQSNGGAARGDVLKYYPVRCINSGPTTGPVAGLFFGRMFGFDNVITVDMGGTSFEVSLVSQGVIRMVKNVDIHRYRIGSPLTDINTIGAGGGSIAWVDPGGRLYVGPQSAEAVPGPACYAKGGEQPTVTDANVVLGYFNPSYLLGGRVPINAELSRKAIRDKVASRLRISVESAALGINSIVNNNMVNAIKEISIERGYDTRDFSLVAGGGCSPAHAGRLAELMSIPIVLIPKVASFLCAFGDLLTGVRYDYTRTHAARFSDIDFVGLNRDFDEMERQAISDLESEGFSKENIEIVRSMDIRYLGQAHECKVIIPRYEITKETFPDIEELFHKEHQRLYTFADRGSMCEFINIGVTASSEGARIEFAAKPRVGEDPSKAQKGKRTGFFEEYEEPVEIPVYDGSKIQVGNVIKGPAIVEEETTTVVVFPKWQLQLDGRDVYKMTLKEEVV